MHGSKDLAWMLTREWALSIHIMYYYYGKWLYGAIKGSKRLINSTFAFMESMASDINTYQVIIHDIFVRLYML